VLGAKSSDRQSRIALQIQNSRGIIDEALQRDVGRPGNRDRSLIDHRERPVSGAADKIEEASIGEGTAARDNSAGPIAGHAPVSRALDLSLGR
jgi:hypothetical protein